MGTLITVLLLGCFFSILKGVIQYNFYKKKKKIYYKTEGVIVDNRYATDGSRYNHDIYYPVVEYTDRNGETIRIRSDYYNTDMPRYPVGTTVSILVNPDDNTRLLFDDKEDEIIFPFVWIGLGALCAIGIITYCVYFWNVLFE